jgi:hypothetical protein
MSFSKSKEKPDSKGRILKETKNGKEAAVQISSTVIQSKDHHVYGNRTKFDSD